MISPDRDRVYDMTTGRFATRSMVMIAAWGWLMIAWVITAPRAPVLLRVKVPPWISSSLRWLLRG